MNVDAITDALKTFVHTHRTTFSEISTHMNVMVRRAHDEGVYCVDVGVVKAGAVPDAVKRKSKWVCIENDAVITFAEVERLVIYPMLLAQFIGIVHEIKRNFMRSPSPDGFDRHQHLPPTLIALGHFSGNSAAIVRSYGNRSILVCVAENFDVRLAAQRTGECRSPLYWDKDEELGNPGAARLAEVALGAGS